MSRFFFDVNDGTERCDESGIEIESVADLRKEVLQAISGLVADYTAKSVEPTFVVRVRDESGDVLMKARLICQIEKY